VCSVLLRDLPYANPDALVRVSLNTPGLPRTSDLHTDATYVHLAATASRSFEGFAAFYTNTAITLTEGDEAERVNAAMVSPGVFALLDVRPAVGTVFAPGDTAWVGSSPIMISEELWDRRFGRDPAIVSRTINLNFGEREVIGVLPRSFDFTSPGLSLVSGEVVVDRRRSTTHASTSSPASGPVTHRRDRTEHGAPSLPTLSDDHRRRRCSAPE
jgi:putative ABC transport system permease protein